MCCACLLVYLVLGRLIGQTESNHSVSCATTCRVTVPAMKQFTLVPSREAMGGITSGESRGMISTGTVE
jgi:hypothetical protein